MSIWQAPFGNTATGGVAHSVMAVSKHKQTQCKHCEDNYTTGFDAQYCSEQCFYREKGSSAQNILKHDHRLCGTCAAILKQIDPPSEEWEHKRQSMQEVLLENGAELIQGDSRIEIDATEATGHRPITDAVIGFQDSTPEATDVLRDSHTDKYSIEQITRTGLGCECGNADTTHTSDILQQADLVRVLSNYVQTFRLLYHEGQLDQMIDKDIFFTEYKRSQDITYALGKALHSK